ncbi:unnamed protein product, partial [Mesorhabditis spiculigera]
MLSDEGPTFRFKTGHTGKVNHAAFNFFGNQFATAGSDGSIKLFEAKDGAVPIFKDKIGEHPGAQIWCISWAHPRFGQMLASAGHDCKLIIWKRDELFGGGWKKEYEYTGHQASVHTVAFAPYAYGLKLVAGSMDGFLSVHSYNRESKEWTVAKIPNAHDKGVNGVSWAPSRYYTNENGQTQLTAQRFVSCGNEKLAKIWVFDPNEGWKLEYCLKGHTDYVTDVQFCMDAQDGWYKLASVGMDDNLFIWETNNIERAEYRTQCLVELGGPANRICWMNRDKLFVDGEFEASEVFQFDGEKWGREDGNLDQSLPRQSYDE